MRMYIRAHTYMLIYTHVYTHVYIYIYTHTHIYIYIYIYTCVYIYIYDDACNAQKIGLQTLCIHTHEETPAASTDEFDTLSLEKGTRTQTYSYMHWLPSILLYMLLPFSPPVSFLHYFGK